MNTSEFINFIENNVITELHSFVSESGFDKDAYVSWGRFNSEDETDLFGDKLIPISLDKPDTNGLRILFVEPGDESKSPTVNSPQLIFGLTASGVLQVTSSHKNNEKPEVITEISHTDGLQPSHIISLFQNQLEKQIDFNPDQGKAK